MGISHRNYLYYGFLLNKITVNECKLTTNLRIIKISDEYFLLYSKILNIDDGVDSINSVPETFVASELKALNPDLNDDFFTDNLFVEELKESIYKFPKFYVCCCTLSSFSFYNSCTGHLIYNTQVDISI